MRRDRERCGTTSKRKNKGGCFCFVERWRFSLCEVAALSFLLSGGLLVLPPHRKIKRNSAPPRKNKEEEKGPPQKKGGGTTTKRESGEGDPR